LGLPQDAEGWVFARLSDLARAIGASAGTLSYITRSLLADGRLTERRVIGRRRLLRVVVEPSEIQTLSFEVQPHVQSLSRTARPSQVNAAASGHERNVQGKDLLAMVADLCPDVAGLIEAGQIDEATSLIFEPFRCRGFCDGVWRSRVAQYGVPLCLLAATITLAKGADVRDRVLYLSGILARDGISHTVPKDARTLLAEGKRAAPQQPEPQHDADHPEPALLSEDQAEPESPPTAPATEWMKPERQTSDRPPLAEMMATPLATLIERGHTSTELAECAATLGTLVTDADGVPIILAALPGSEPRQLEKIRDYHRYLLSKLRNLSEASEGSLLATKAAVVVAYRQLLGLLIASLRKNGYDVPDMPLPVGEHRAEKAKKQRKAGMVFRR